MPYKHSLHKRKLSRFIEHILRLLEWIFQQKYSLENLTTTNQVAKFFDLLKPSKSQFELKRIGGFGDGSYVLPLDIQGIKFCISPGFGGVCNFEDHLSQFGIKSLVFDKLISNLGKNSPHTFVSKNLSTYSDEENNLITLGDTLLLLEDGDISSDLILQMDIEGSEWMVLNSCSPVVLKKFRIIIVEFHSLPLLRFDSPMRAVMEGVIHKLLKDFTVVNVNNNESSGRWTIGEKWYPDTIEVTFHRNDRHSLELGLYDTA